MMAEFPCPKTKLNFYIVEDPTIDIANCIINSLTAITATVANLLVIISIWRTPSLHTPSNVLVVGLALSDFCIGLVVQPIFLASIILKLRGLQDMYCSSTVARSIPGFYLGGVTIISLTVISLDRYIGIKLHLRYREIVTVKRVTGVLVTIWLAFTVSSLSILWSDVTFMDLLGVAISVLNFTVTGVTYFMIYRVVRRHKAQIRAQLQVQQQQRDGDSTNMPQLHKSSWSMFLISFAFVLCCLPHMVIRLVIQTTGQSWLTVSLLEFSYLLLFVNSTINPALYCWRFKNVRLAVIQTTNLMLRRSWNE